MVAVCTSCDRNGSNELTVFYDFDSLIDQQIIHLTRMEPLLLKEAEMDGRHERIEIDRPDSSTWAKELDIFRQLDLNAKRLNEGRYEILDGRKDPASNLRVCEYRAKINIPLSLVRIYYEGRPHRIRKVDGKFKESNGLYSNEQFFSLELADISNKTMLTGYSIMGSQKMILGDSVRFKIRGELSYRY